MFQVCKIEIAPATRTALLIALETLFLDRMDGLLQGEAPVSCCVSYRSTVKRAGSRQHKIHSPVLHNVTERSREANTSLRGTGRL